MKTYLFIFLFTISFFPICYGQVITSTKDSLSNPDSLSKLPNGQMRAKGFIAPAILIGYGAISFAGDNFIRRLDYSTNAELREDHPSFAFKLDNYLRYAPAVAVYGLDLVGIKAKNNILDRSVMLITS